MKCISFRKEDIKLYRWKLVYFPRRTMLTGRLFSYNSIMHCSTWMQPIYVNLDLPGIKLNYLIFYNTGESNLKVCGTLKDFSCNIGVQIRTVPKLFCRQFFLQEKKMLKGKHDVLFHNGSRELKVLEQVVWAEVIFITTKIIILQNMYDWISDNNYRIPMRS